MNSIFQSHLQTPIGIIEINADEKSILSVLFVNSDNPVTTKIENKITLKAKKQLEDYFTKKSTVFDLPLYFSATEFQQNVWKQLQTIPYGKTISYLQLAVNLGDEKCIRAAASANGKNPFAIIIPCHRVIGKDGTLTGYAGGLWRKKWLLEHEENIQKQIALF